MLKADFMKLVSLPHARLFSRALALLPAAAVFTGWLPAQTPPSINGSFDFFGNVTYDGAAGSISQTLTADTVWNIADGVTVIVQNNTATASGGLFGANMPGSFTITRLGTTGRVQFIGNTTTNQAPLFSLGGSSSSQLHITGADFIGNEGTLGAGATFGGGVFHASSGAGPVELIDCLFLENRARHGGVAWLQANMDVTRGTFIGNAADSWNGAVLMGNAAAGYGGAFNLYFNSAREAIVRESDFSGNWAQRGGGAIATRNRYSVQLRDTTGFTDNFAGFGGALFDGGNAVSDGVTVDMKYTGTTGVTEFLYSGNKAKGSQLTLGEVTAATENGLVPFTPDARGGGFYYSGEWNNEVASTHLRFDIATGVTVQIGQPGNPSSWDSIATADKYGTAAMLRLTGAGAGRLILHADNSYWQGAVDVGTGSLLLGNQNAQLGGAVTVATGATFGGSGTLVTHKQDGSVFAGRTSLTLAGGANLAVGTETAAAGETLSVFGNVSAGAGVVFNHDLFSDGSASKLWAENINLAGSATINLGLLASGTFTLMEWAGTGFDAANLTLTIDGVQGSSRANAALSLDGKSLVVTSAVNNLVMKWTGAEGAVWTRRTTGAQRNWADAGSSGETKYYNGDSVVFDGQADAANPGNRVITIADGGVTLSGMEVTGTERYEFRGAGGIAVEAGAVGNAAFTPTGKLIKSGTGELVFANTAANSFAGGIEVAGGTITFDRAAQLGAGTGGITVSDSATLHATGAVSGTLAERITIAAGKTAELRVDQGGALVYSGTLSAGGAGSALRKTGDGAVLLTGDNAANTVAVAVDAGSLTLLEPSAVLGGAITVNSGATLGGVGTAGNGGSVKIAAGGILEAGVDTAQPATLTVHNLELTGDAVLKVDLYKTVDGAYQQSDRILDTGTSVIGGSNIIDLTSFAAGTFNLGNLAALAADARVTLSGMTLPTDGRLSATLSGMGGVLELVMTSDQSRVMTWTGGGGSTWNLANTNWTDNGAVNQFSYGDRVLFDGTAGADGRTILIDAGEVRIADMTVSGDADHTFTGGGIHASPDNVQDDGAGNVIISDATGKLTKTGNGVLTFANGKNTFFGGIDLAGGVVVVGSGDQLGTSGATGITFTGDAVLRASADLALDDDIAIDAGKTGAVDSDGHVVTLKGTVAGAADATFAKDGAGAMVLESDLSGFSGTLAVRGGTLRVGAEDLLTDGGQAAIVVNSGATLDLAGHDQSLANLTGAGEIALGDAELIYTVDSAGETFAGSFTGAGAVIKEGAGKWTLAGPSSHTGGFLLKAGELGLASSAALGSGRLTLGAPSGKISLEADGLTIANDITAGTGTLTLASNGHDAELSGNIGGDTIVLDGTGTLTLSGFNSYAKLQVNTPLAIARRAESITGITNISDGSTLEFRGVASGVVSATLTGDRVLFTDSALTLSGQNELKTLVVGAGSNVTSTSTGALGGANADITVRDGGRLFVSNEGTLGHDMTVDGGALVFGSSTYGSAYKLHSLALSGTLDFRNGGEIRLGGLLNTGIHTAAVAYGGISNLPDYDANQDGMFMTVSIVDGNLLRVTAYDMALEPGKDIVAGIDAMGASMDAVYSHLSDQLLAPLAGIEKSASEKGRRRGGGRASAEPETPTSEKGVWFRAIGSFAEHESDTQFLGYTANTTGGVMGYDWINAKGLMLGGYAGYSSTRLKTANNATTDIDLPIVGLYGALRMGNYYLAADVAGGLGGADTERREAQDNDVTGSYDLDSIAGSLEIGRVIPFFTTGQIRPSLGLHYTTLSFQDYEETGRGAVRLDDVSTDFLQAVLRIDGSKEIKFPGGLPGMVDLGLGWRQNLQDKRTDVRATLVEYPDATLEIRGDEYDKNTAIARVGFRMLFAKATLFSLSYDYNYVPFGNHRNATRRDTFIASLRHTW